jgi:hypothetical protein
MIFLCWLSDRLLEIGAYIPIAARAFGRKVVIAESLQWVFKYFYSTPRSIALWDAVSHKSVGYCQDRDVKRMSHARVANTQRHYVLMYGRSSNARENSWYDNMVSSAYRT